MKLFWLFFRESPGVAFLATLSSALAGAATPVLIQMVAAGVADEQRLTRGYAAAFVAMGAAMVLFRVVPSLLLSKLHQRVIKRIRLQAVSRILSAELVHLERHGSSRLWGALTQDIHMVSAGLGQTPKALAQGFTFAGCMVLMFMLSPALSLTALGFFLLVIAPVIRSGLSKYRAGYDVARATHEGLYGTFRSVIDGIKDLKLDTRQRQVFFDEELGPMSDRLEGNNHRLGTIWTVMTSLPRIAFLAYVGLLFAVVRDRVEISNATFLSFVLAAAYAQGPAEALVSALLDLVNGTKGLAKLESFELEFKNQPTEGIEEVGRFRSIALEGVTHTYRKESDDRPFTLGPIDLAIAPGEILFIVGANGSGKTTLAKLLTGLYAPKQGRILLDGAPVEAADRQRYRSLFAAVFFDFHIFERLVGSSADDEALNAKARHYLERLQLVGKTSVEGRRLTSTQLSQGQRKRLALLAAYLRDRPVFLFDEWAADQDPAFKTFFYRELLPELKRRGKAVIVISHDDRYFDVADRLLYLEDGHAAAVPGVAPPRAEVA